MSTCPHCQKETKTTQTKYGLRESCEDCQIVGWNGREMIDEETRKARLKFHATFDPIWQEGFMDRTKAYKVLAEKMNMDEKNIHGAVMNKEMCQKATKHALEIFHQFKYTQN